MGSVLIFLGFISIGLALALSGLLGSGDRIRANYTNEDKENRNSRLRNSGILLFIGIFFFALNFLFFSNTISK